MGSSGPPRSLRDLEVLIVDCQATAAAPRGRLLEVGWARASSTPPQPTARLVALPPGERIPPAVARITGITDTMVGSGVDGRVVWQELSDVAAALTLQPAPTVIHFARFEGPLLGRLAGGTPPLDVVCTHAIASRLLPTLPRRSLRALAGYFGKSVGALRRSADHVEATAFVWRELVRLLEADGIGTWGALKAWLAASAPPTGRRPRVWPMERAARLAVPDAPGVYRMLRTSGEVLYVGKAASLRDRVNSYFRHQRGVPERLLEMLSQARALSFEVTPTALDAALLEPDEIKRLRPPYNIALTDANRHIWFTGRDLIGCSPTPSGRWAVGPFPSGETLVQFAALSRERPDALGSGRWAPDRDTFREGYERFCTAHVEMSLGQWPATTRLLRVGARLWREGRRDREADADEQQTATDGQTVEARTGGVPRSAWTPARVQLSLEWLVIRVALARRRAGWFTRLAEASVTWCEPGASQSRLIVIENGDITRATTADPGAVPPVPPGCGQSVAARLDAFTVARFDRLRVLTTEIKRLSAAGAPVAVRFSTATPLAGARLASLLAWL